MAGETRYEGLKKRPIVEMAIENKKRKRRERTNMGDMCLPIEEIKESEQESTLKKVNKFLQKGVRLSIKQDKGRFSTKLPTVR
jgi:hypothetical protein